MKQYYTFFVLAFMLGFLNSNSQTEFRKDSTHIYSWFNGDWLHQTRELYAFGYEGNKETHVLRLHASGSNWVNYYQRNKDYDASNNITESIQQNWRDGAWVDASRDTYVYDGMGNEIRFQYAIKIDGVWTVFRREISTYNGNTLSSKTFENRNGGNDLVSEKRFLYDYGLTSYTLQEEIEQIYYADVYVWQNVGKIKYTYTDFNEIEKVEDIGFNQQDGAFNDFATLQTFFNYNVLQQLESQVYQIHINEGYRNQEQYLFVYELGNQTEFIRQEWDNTNSIWKNASRILRTFDANNNETSLIYQSWKSDIESWQGFTRIDSFWSASEAFDVTLTTNKPKDMEYAISVYPNPTSNFITINSTSPVNYVTFFNLQGKRLFLSKNQTKIDVSQLESGLYLAKIEYGSNTITKKVIIN
ncbi:T9SS type A sorting domain-containing protein [Algibacter sp. AS12]|uniref:T9SS type A sorting domain-containing protein n=1 Tax=Algibacter sp. AS12 TaxID=3135773 RepID=UPI00398AD284